MKKIIQLIDQNLLFIISLFLLVFIPLFPKWPLFDILPGYNVRIRLDDFFVLAAFLIWGIYFLRGKIDLKKIPLAKPIVIYLIVGFLSTLSAIFLTKTVYFESYHILKIYLHFFRRIEYFSLFFIFYSAIVDKKQIKLYLSILITAVLGVTIYGFGQKYLYWPAYSTMNREFSKGITLYLTEHARVLSTFGGHYDLAAYTMITLIVLITLAFVVKNKWLRIIILFVSLIEYWLLILTASRTSFIAYIAGLAVAFLFLAFKKGYIWSLIRGMSVILISMFIMFSLGDLSERFAQVIKLDQLKDSFNKAFVSPPVNGIPIDENLSFEEQLKRVAAKSDTPPTTVKPGSAPADVYQDSELIPETVESVTESGEATFSTRPRSYSENALQFGLSSGIRLDALWPRALNAFKTNPLLGTGYSTLVKTQVWEQTPAESTDNDYLRLLGETGLLGLISFLSIFALTIGILYKSLKISNEPLEYGLFAAGIGLTVGLLINALYIDVFEASKVAYSYWSIIGIILALSGLVLSKKKE